MNPTRRSFLARFAALLTAPFVARSCTPEPVFAAEPGAGKAWNRETVDRIDASIGCIPPGSWVPVPPPRGVMYAHVLTLDEVRRDFGI